MTHASDFRTDDSIMLTFTPRLLDGRHLFCTSYLLSSDAALCTCTHLCWLCLATSMYISALSCALGTPSEFSSVPILVADELAHSSSCATPILGNYPTLNYLSLEQLSYSCDLAIRVATTRNIRTRFPKQRTSWTPTLPRAKVAKPKRNTF